MSRVPTFRALDERLRARDGASPFARDAVRDALSRHTREGGAMPWFVTLLSAAGAWLAAACFFAFLACAGVLDSEWVLLVLGAVIFGVGLVLRRVEQGVFLDQVGLAFVMVGPTTLATAMHQITHSETVVAWCLLAVSVAALATIPDPVVAFLLTLSAVVSGWFLALDTGAPWADEVGIVVVVALVHGTFARGGSRLPRAFGRLFEPVTNGLFVSALALLTYRAIADRFGANEPTWLAGTLDIVVLIALTALSTGASLVAVHDTGTSRKTEAIGLVVVFFVALATATYRMPELVSATGLVVLAFRRRRPMLVAVACVMTMLAGGLYYYELSLTLLEKSVAMFTAGVIFLVARKIVVWRFPEADTAEVPS